MKILKTSAIILSIIFLAAGSIFIIVRRFSFNEIPIETETAPVAAETAYEPEIPAPTKIIAENVPTPTEFPAPTPTPAPEIIFDPEPEPEPEPVKLQLTSRPARMRIPALSADAEIIDTGFDETETMEIADSAHLISWLREGAIPGNDGSAILGGHNRWKGEIGQLINLDSLEVGDAMEIDYFDGTTLTFYCESVFVYALATAPAAHIMDGGGEARVTVITCKDPYNPSTGTSDYRIIAVFKKEGDFILPDPPVTPFPTLTPEDLSSAEADSS